MSDEIYYGKAKITINGIESEYEDVMLTIDHFFREDDIPIFGNIKPKVHYMGNHVKIKNGDKTLLDYSIEYRGEMKDE